MSAKHWIEYLDSAKALTIITVVSSIIILSLGNLLFAWHMPFFSGLRLGLPYLIFGAIGILAELA